MDELGFAALLAELRDDVGIVERAGKTARARFVESSAACLEGCAFHLVRLFNVVEQMALRVAGAFENDVAQDGGWHAELIRRVSVEVPGVRPPLFPPSARPALRELRGFRHVITHAYDLELDRERMKFVLKSTDLVVANMGSWVDATCDGHLGGRCVGIVCPARQWVHCGLDCCRSAAERLDIESRKAVRWLFQGLSRRGGWRKQNGSFGR